METVKEIKIEPNLAGNHYPLTKIGTSYMKIGGAITGCGLAQIYGLYFAQERKENFEKAKEIARKWGAGGIIGTLGTSSLSHEKDILNLGFELLAEYPNYHHHRLSFAGTNKDIQRLYIYRL